MSKIEVNQSHTLSREEARENLVSLEEMMGKYGVSLDWKGDCAAIKGFGVSGDVSIQDECVEIVVKLGMVAKAAGVDPDRLKGSIVKRLATAFSEESA